jgi:exopolyphosphatase/guanosine-5'-triphosphate,3'-diphosphate pyrophosphatase
MSEITPRWEWRSFGPRFGEAEMRLAALTPSGIQESDEVYLLTGSGRNVKFRAALMDIKVLTEVNADGLEQWIPVMKASFPLPAAEKAKVLEALRLPPSEDRRLVFRAFQQLPEPLKELVGSYIRKDFRELVFNA